MPTAVPDPTEIVRIEEPEPGAAMDAGLKLAVAPEGRPEALNAIAESKPPETAVVIVLAPSAPWSIVSEVGEAEMVKLGVDPEPTVSVRLAVSVTPPPLPVTVTV